MSLSPPHTLVLTPSRSVCSNSGVGVSGSGSSLPSLWGFLSLPVSGFLSPYFLGVSIMSLSLCLFASVSLPQLCPPLRGISPLISHPLCLSDLPPLLSLTPHAWLCLASLCLSFPVSLSLSSPSPPFFLPYPLPAPVYHQPSTTSRSVKSLETLKEGSRGGSRAWPCRAVSPERGRLPDPRPTSQQTKDGAPRKDGGRTPIPWEGSHPPPKPPPSTPRLRSLYNYVDLRAWQAGRKAGVPKLTLSPSPRRSTG